LQFESQDLNSWACCVSPISITQITSPISMRWFDTIVCGGYPIYTEVLKLGS